MQKILIIEDDSRVADLLRAGLEEAGYQTVVAFDGAMGLRLFKAGMSHQAGANDHVGTAIGGVSCDAGAATSGFDLVISDIILPKLNGFELCCEIRKVNENVPILMLTALGSADDKLDGFDAGADDYMVKPFDFRELCARVKVLLRRGASPQGQKPAPDSLQYADLTVNLNLREVRRGGLAIRLSPKEYNLLVFMLENAERVISRTEISEKVWSTHFDTGTNFIDVYINYLRKKIDRDFPLKLIHTKPGVGYIFSDKRPGDGSPV